MDKIEFADGTQYNCGFCGQPTENILFITLAGASYVEAAQIFEAPERLPTITFRPANGQPVAFHGYTVFQYMVREQAGIRVSLRRPYVGEAIA